MLRLKIPACTFWCGSIDEIKSELSEVHKIAPTDTDWWEALGVVGGASAVSAGLIYYTLTQRK